LKRFLDVVFAITLVILLLPIFVIVALLVFFFLSKKIFFIQKRIGLNNRFFFIYKFKTMTEDEDENGELLPDIVRLTKLGKNLRRLSLDELPQLWNIIKGDMSFVGPRPLLPEYLELYSDYQIRRHESMPGITGWAQVNGRNAISWEEKFNLDVWYVDNHSFKLDLKILWKTVIKVIKRDGISSNSSITMEKFKGSKS
jgi:lipopolysaccharide/colanic/teichoic acid biosynthesis glycosyltransferase